MLKSIATTFAAENKENSGQSKLTYADLEKTLELRIELMTSRIILSCKKFSNPKQEFLLAEYIVKDYRELSKLETPAILSVIGNEYEQFKMNVHAIARLRLSGSHERAAQIQKSFLRSMLPVIWENVGADSADAGVSRREPVRRLIRAA